VLSKDQLLALATTSKIHTHTLTTGGEVGIRVMSGTEREAWERQAFGDDGKADLKDFRAKLVAKTVCDASGVRMFSDDDITAVSGLPFPTLRELYDVSAKVNSLTTEDVDELTKN
jgi:hypothetical protein